MQRSREPIGPSRADVKQRHSGHKEMTLMKGIEKGSLQRECINLEEHGDMRPASSWEKKAR